MRPCRTGSSGRRSSSPARAVSHAITRAARARGRRVSASFGASATAAAGSGAGASAASSARSAALGTASDERPVWEARSPMPPSGRMVGNRMTSRIAGAPVSSITMRSMPMPSPPVGGRPYSSARM